jgi:tetratricopeptide (TPR) repeat protein
MSCGSGFIPGNTALASKPGSGTRVKKPAGWTAFPYPNERFHYPAGALKKHWSRLHLGDKEPYPSAQLLEKLCKTEPKIVESIPRFDTGFEGLSERVLEAWRCYHAGEFEQAAQIGLSLGWIGQTVANKATAIYANDLEQDASIKLRLLKESMERAERARRLNPRHANSHYLYAYALGRHSQNTSILEALAQGLAGKIKDALDRTLELEPEHAEAHTATATYHAEIIDKVGSMLGGLTYGASKDLAVEHYERALELHPHSAIARIEFANGLLMLFGKSRVEQATELVVEASRLEPCDAMERLDTELAKSRLEEDA